MKVPGIEDLVQLKVLLIVSLHNDILLAKEKLKLLEWNVNLTPYPANITVYEQIHNLKYFIVTNEDLISKYKIEIRDERLKQLGL